MLKLKMALFLLILSPYEQANRNLLKEQLSQQLEKKKDKIEEKLNKALGGKLEDEKAKELIKNLKSIF